MKHFDVFNGDADGICALHQLRLAEPVQAELVTGVKRDIALLERVQASPGDRVTVLDVSLERNRAALLRLLAQGARVRYFDHHDAGVLPVHPALEAFIEEAGGVCTSMLVDRYLGGRFRAWAVVAAFGDQLAQSALGLAAGLSLEPDRVQALRSLGESLNYNAYGETEADLLIPPAELYRTVRRYADPFDLIARESLVGRLADQRSADMRRVLALSPYRSAGGFDAYLLPDEAWSRRVSGSFANQLARDDPSRAHAVLTPGSRGGFAVSLRAPGAGGASAADVCRRFPTGGGRREAGGIDRLAPGELEALFAALADSYPPRG
ncbi:MAG TPA: acetyltransferase [Burkholderiales bacterium]|nr:acetyltransferase [Burkholderiales bacterium]